MFVTNDLPPFGLLSCLEPMISIPSRTGALSLRVTCVSSGHVCDE